ncbi:sulfur oxidation c-type cytochrome SoxA [Magnetofaba australis]|uniref:SoxAX cytochrome complex subunit A n=1 Tax=Magnetofaba australis IT-1 TaxID=1434232 RepID=A0A1Y2K7A0_9PROT|nr:sulfur oxidation c-type cytochrome SoxA [Magnetofaba australis]OSM05197.1 putative diheme cytochrome SoxA [Magnetofaba australis IT-1]
MNPRRLGVVSGLIGALAFAGSALAMDIQGYDSAIDQGLHKYSPKFVEMAEFPPTEGVLDEAMAAFNKDRGGKSCASCHGENGARLVGVGTQYPKWDPKAGKPALLQTQINSCLTDHMGQKELKWESGDQILLMLAVKSLSNGMPLAVRTDGPMAAWVKKGEAFYNERQGHFDVACKHCHNVAAGTNIRAEFMSAPDNTGMGELAKLVAELPEGPERERRNAAGATIGSGSIDHWPTYRLKWGKPASMQRRLRTCNKNVRAQPKAYGDDYYIALEVYLASISNGLPVNVPGFRP